MVSFGAALEEIKAGKRATRLGWSGAGIWIKLHRPSEQSRNVLAYLFQRTAQGEFVPWIPTQTDLLADDWTVM